MANNALDDMQYDTPQDKLLVMLLERINSLEDEQSKLRQAVEKNNEYLDNLVSKSSSVYFGISIRAKLPPPQPLPNYAPAFGQAPAIFGFGNFNDHHRMTDEKLDVVKNIITTAFPQCNITVARGHSTNLYLEFETPMLLDTLKDTLEIPLLHHVHILNWARLSKSEMTTLLHRNPYEI